MKDIIFKAMNHPEIKWNVTKNKMYKELIESVNQDEKKKDKYWFFSHLFPFEVCELIMNYKKQDEKYYIKCFIKENKMKEEFLIKYLLSKYSEYFYNQGLEGRTKHLKKRMSANDFSLLFYYAINRLKNPDFCKETTKSYRKLSLIDAKKYCDEKVIEENKKKIEELKPYEFLEKQRYNDIYFVKCRFKGFSKENPLYERVYIIRKRDTRPAYNFYIPLKMEVVDGELTFQSSKSVKETPTTENEQKQQEILVTFPQGHNGDVFFHLKLGDDSFKNKATFKQIVNNLEIISYEKMPYNYRFTELDNNYRNREELKDVDYFKSHLYASLK
jgi:uncharacterized protein (DUF2164 family)